jgi:hypothetical protein
LLNRKHFLISIYWILLCSHERDPSQTLVFLANNSCNILLLISLNYFLAVFRTLLNINPNPAGILVSLTTFSNTTKYVLSKKPSVQLKSGRLHKISLNAILQIFFLNHPYFIVSFHDGLSDLW